jgi:hypothetical protein
VSSGWKDMSRKLDSQRADSLMYELTQANRRIAELEQAIHEKAIWPPKRMRIKRVIQEVNGQTFDLSVYKVQIADDGWEILVGPRSQRDERI